MINASLALLAVSIASALVLSRKPHKRKADTRRWDWDLQALDGQPSGTERGVIYIDQLRGHVGRAKR